MGEVFRTIGVYLGKQEIFSVEKIENYVLYFTLLYFTVGLRCQDI